MFSHTLISACKTYTSPKKLCLAQKFLREFVGAVSAWLQRVKLMKSVMGHQRGELDICGGENPPVYGETHCGRPHTHTHIILCQNKELQVGFERLPHRCQSNRWMGIFTTSAVWMCTFQSGNMRLENFLPETEADRQTHRQTENWIRCADRNFHVVDGWWNDSRRNDFQTVRRVSIILLAVCCFFLVALHNAAITHWWHAIVFVWFPKDFTISKIESCLKAVVTVERTRNGRREQRLQCYSASCCLDVTSITSGTLMPGMLFCVFELWVSFKLKSK